MADQVREAARAIADQADAAREADRRNGLAPGATLADLIETAIVSYYDVDSAARAIVEKALALPEVKTLKECLLQAQNAALAAGDRAEKAEAKYRDTQEMIRSATEPHYVRRIAELSSALLLLHPEREASDGDQCQECHASVATPHDLEPTPECNACAQALLTRAREAARSLGLAPKGVPRG